MKKQTISLIVVLIVIVGAIWYFESLKVQPAAVDMDDVPSVSKQTARTPEMQEEIPAEVQERIKMKERSYPAAPELASITGYLNADEPFFISDFRGKVVLIDFWTYSCINCIRTLPHLVDWHAKYADKGLVIIGVHTPEFEFEKDPENVQEAMNRHGVEYLVAQDNNYGTWRAYGNRFWPRKYLIDQDGFIRYDHIGEGAYAETEMAIQELLEEIGEDVEGIEAGTVEDQSPRIRTTKELYAGYKFNLPRGQDLGNEGGLQADQTATYTVPETIISDRIYLDGSWQSNVDDLQIAGEQGTIILNFQATSVNIVADSDNGPVEMEVRIDGVFVSEEDAGSDVEFDGERAFVTVDEPRLYNVYEGTPGRFTLALTSTEGFNFNAFTFG